MTVYVNVTKDGDPSYGSVFQLTFPWFLRYRKTEEISVNTDFSCTRETPEKKKSEGGQGRDNKMLICYIGNPMYNNTGVEFRVFLQVPVELSETSIELHMNITTLSNETNLDDNQEKYSVEAVNHVQASLFG